MEKDITVIVNSERTERLKYIILFHQIENKREREQRQEARRDGDIGDIILKTFQVTSDTISLA